MQVAEPRRGVHIRVTALWVHAIVGLAWGELQWFRARTGGARGAEFERSAARAPAVRGQGDERASPVNTVGHRRLDSIAYSICMACASSGVRREISIYILDPTRHRPVRQSIKPNCSRIPICTRQVSCKRNLDACLCVGLSLGRPSSTLRKPRYSHTRTIVRHNSHSDTRD